jgi:hypothetical protein
MQVKKPFRIIKRIFGNLYFLTFLNGFLIASLFYMKTESNYENELFQAIHHSINKQIDANDNEDSVIVKVMHTAHNLLSSRSSIFEDDESLDGFKVDYMHPATIDLMTARGACGSYSMVLARLLQTYHYAVRIGQMKAGGSFAAHNIIETEINNRWIVLDPTFNLYFVTPDNKLATFKDIKNNWSFYSKQVPSNYDMNYKYEDVRYMNWEKVPVLFPVAKKIFSAIFGKETIDNFCLRVHFLKMYDFYFYCTLFIYLPIILYTLKRIIKTKLFPTHDTPVTIRNIAKYARVRASGDGFNRSINS